MPCDLIQLQSVDFENAKGHEDILADALRSLGYSVQVYGKSIQFQRAGVSGNYFNGRFSADQNFDADEVKRAFGKKTVQFVAKKYGWTFSEKNGKIQIRKRV